MPGVIGINGTLKPDCTSSLGCIEIMNKSNNRIIKSVTEIPIAHGCKLKISFGTYIIIKLNAKQQTPVKENLKKKTKRLWAFFRL